MRAVLLLLGCAGCDGVFGIGTYESADATAADTVPTPDCAGTGLFRYCPGGAVQDQVTLGAGTLRTDLNPQCVIKQQALGGNVCVIAALDVHVTGVVTVRGTRPLVLVAMRTLTVDPGGSIDASAHRGLAGAPPGANDPSCISAPAHAQSVSYEGAGGGAGGSFGGHGGDGGGADDGTKAAASATVTPAALRGGCPGGKGGDLVGGSPGDSGGAVALLGGISLVIRGSVVANGEGGTGGSGGTVGTEPGGGGGGSGGLVDLDAPLVVVDSGALVFAAGGGGGAGQSEVTPGGNGEDPSSPAMPAKGGLGMYSTDQGGAGSGPSEPNGSPGGSFNGTTGGAGGGGGGAGIVKLYGMTMVMGTIVPPPS